MDDLQIGIDLILTVYNNWYAEITSPQKDGDKPARPLRICMAVLRSV